MSQQKIYAKWKIAYKKQIYNIIVCYKNLAKPWNVGRDNNNNNNNNNNNDNNNNNNNNNNNKDFY